MYKSVMSQLDCKYCKIEDKTSAKTTTTIIAYIKRLYEVVKKRRWSLPHFPNLEAIHY